MQYYTSMMIPFSLQLSWHRYTTIGARSSTFNSCSITEGGKEWGREGRRERRRKVGQGGRGEEGEMREGEGRRER